MDKSDISYYNLATMYILYLFPSVFDSGRSFSNHIAKTRNTCGTDTKCCEANMSVSVTMCVTTIMADA